MFFIFSFSVENITWVTKNLTSKVSPGIIYCIQNVSKKSKVNIVWVSYYNLIFTSQFFLGPESGHEFKWFPAKDQDSDWLTHLIYQLKACFFGRKLYSLEIMSWLRSQKNLICELQVLCYEFRKTCHLKKSKVWYDMQNWFLSLFTLL